MMIPRQKPLSRRTVLRGAGVALGLPWLEAMAPSALAASAPADTKSPVRMAVLYMANGVNPSQWTPEGRGRDFGPFSDAQTARGPQGSVTGGRQSLECGGKHRRRALHKRVEPAHVHYDHQDTGRGHQHPWTFDGSGGGAKGGGRNTAAIARIRNRARIDGRGCERRLHPRVRMPYRMEQSHDPVGARNKPPFGVCATVSAAGPAGDQQRKTRSYSTVCSNNRTRCERNSAPPTRPV